MLELSLTVTNKGNIDVPNGGDYEPTAFPRDFAWEGEFAFGDTLEEAVNKFGSEVIFDLAKRMCKTDIQNGLRGVGNRLASRGEGPEGAKTPAIVTSAEITDAMAKWLGGYRPGVQRTAAPKQLSQRDVERFFADPSKSQEEKLAMLEQLRATLAALM